MGTGYTRADTANNIADGNIINANDLDGEFDAIEAAFATTGHTHDGTAAEGGAILVLGPTQEFVVSSTEAKPSSNAGLSLGTDLLQFNNLYIDGTAYIDGLGESILVDTTSKIQFRDVDLFINSSADGQLDLEADTTIELTAPTVSLTNDLKLKSDGAGLFFGADDEIVVIHSHNVGLNMRNSAGFYLALQSSDTTIEAGDTLGELRFNAPQEASGGDAVAIGAAISVVAEDTFDSTTNSTAIVFKTQTTGNAIERMRISSSGDLEFVNGINASFGTNGELKIRHDGTNSIIDETGTGHLYIRASNINLQNIDAAPDENMITMNADGAVNLFYNGSNKFHTTDTGANLIGTLTADGLTVDGATVLDVGDEGTLQIGPTTTVADENQTIEMRGSNGSNELQRFQIANRGEDGRVDFKYGRAGATPTKAISIGAGTGDISFYEDTGTTAKFFWDSSEESLGIGDTAPEQTLTVVSNTASSYPASSGTTQTGIVRIRTSDSGGTLDIGTNGGYGAWLQATNTTDLSANYPILLNPNGGNVGVGITSPQTTFHAATVSANAAYRFESTHSSGIPNLQLKGASSATIRYMDENDAIQARIDMRDGGKFQFIDGDGNQHMVIDSNARVGIGTTTPDNSFHVVAGAAGEVAQFTGEIETRGLSIRSETNTDASAHVVFNSQSGGSKGMFSFETDGTERLRILPGGRVLIGTTSTAESIGIVQIGSGNPAGPTYLGTTVNDNVHALSLVYDVSNNDALNFSMERFTSGTDWTSANHRIQRRVDSTDMGYIEFGNNASANIIFGEANTEYGRIDGSGHLHWGIVDSAPYDNSGSGGIALRQEGMIYNASTGGNTPIVTNRIGSEGDIIQLRTGGVRRGAIAIFNSDPHIMANSDWGLKLYDQTGNHIIHPTNTTGNSYNAQVNLGYSASQFRNGYFYGGLYIHGVDSNSEGSTFWTIRRHNDGGGGGLFPTLVSGKAQMGELYAFDASNGNWCHYSLKKDDAAGGVQTQQISGTGLTIAATNSGGTIQMSNTSGDVDIVVTIYGVEV